MSEEERPLAVDLFSGLGGWAEGLIAAGWRVRAYDIEDMYAATGATMHDHYELVIRDVLDIHGTEVADAQLIVSSSPCTEYSYMAMPWSLAKAKRAAILADETGEARRKLNELYDAQFRIQREACEAAGRHIPMVCENVRGAQEWVGRAKGAYGSYYLWGDVPAMLPEPIGARKVPGFRFDGAGGSFQTASVQHHALDGRKNSGGSWFAIGAPGQVKVNNNPDGRQWSKSDAEKHRDADGYERNAPDGAKPFGWKGPRTSSSATHVRKAASAAIAKIPLKLSTHIGRVYHPDNADRFARAREVDFLGSWG